MTGAAGIALAASATLVTYALAGYPAILRAMVLLRGRKEGARDEPRSGEEKAGSAGAAATFPTVSVTLPAYNEEAQIAEAIESLLELDYPSDRRQILIVSDGSTDGTDRIVRLYRDRGVELLRVEGRGGKCAAENAARSYLTGEIVVNTDASVRLHPGALKALVSAFEDPAVGVASGRDVSIARIDEDANAGESGYVGYEMWVRDLETAAGGIVGASGCLYAIRRELHDTRVPGELSRDFSSALIARDHGYRAVSVKDAICYVPRAGSLRREYSRKVRTIARGLRTLFARRHLMNPATQGVFGWMLVSHKLCRWLIPWALVLTAAALLALAPGAPWARWLVGAGALAALAGLAGWLWPEDREAPAVLTLPAYFLVGNVATIHAWLRLIAGKRDAVWEPTRRRPAPHAAGQGGAGITSPRS